VEKLFSEIGDGWRHVFGEDSCKDISVRMAKKFSGLDPRNENDRRKFGSHLGILPNGMAKIEECLGDVSKFGALSEDEWETAGQGNKKNRKWGEIKDMEVKTLVGEKHINRARVFYRWLELGRALLTFPLITNKRGVYEDLNCILSHVPLPQRVINFSRWRCGHEVRH